MMPKHAHTPLTEAEIALYEHAAKNLDVAPPYRLQRALANLREARRLLRAVGDEISRHLNDAHSGDRVGDYTHLKPGDSTHDLALCLEMAVRRYLAACEWKEPE